MSKEAALRLSIAGESILDDMSTIYMTLLKNEPLGRKREHTNTEGKMCTEQFLFLDFK
jgi:hypothetical protein